MQSDPAVLNTANFLKMAHGDLPAMRVLAADYFFETWQQYSDWHSFIETGNFSHLRDDLHRCKGGASLFGLERIVALIGAYESPSVLEEKGFDLTVFEQELKAAESAVRAMVG